MPSVEGDNVRLTSTVECQANTVCCRDSEAKIDGYNVSRALTQGKARWRMATVCCMHFYLLRSKKCFTQASFIESQSWIRQVHMYRHRRFEYRSVRSMSTDTLLMTCIMAVVDNIHRRGAAKRILSQSRQQTNLLIYLLNLLELLSKLTKMLTKCKKDGFYYHIS